MPKTATAEPKRVARIHIYMVDINGEIRMVRTTSRAKAIKHFKKGVKAEIPTPDQLVDLVKNDVAVEEFEA